MLDLVTKLQWRGVAYVDTEEVLDAAHLAAHFSPLRDARKVAAKLGLEGAAGTFGGYNVIKFFSVEASYVDMAGPSAETTTCR